MNEWCERCGCVHTQDQVDPEKIIAILSQQIADEIDQEIFEELMARVSPSTIPPTLRNIR